MKWCGFCHKSEQQDDVYRCRQCGYRLEEIRSGQRPVSAEVFTLFFSGGESGQAEIPVVDFDGWHIFYKAYGEQRVTCKRSAEALVLSIGYAKSGTPFSVEELPEELPEQLELEKESWYDDINPMGFRVYHVEMVPWKRMSLRELSPPQRRRFLTWLLTTPPHTAEDGSLCFEI